MLNIKYLIWALLAGAFIPLIGILNGRVGRALGEPFYATVMLFGVAIVLALLVSIMFGKAAPTFQNLNSLRSVFSALKFSSSDITIGDVTPASPTSPNYL